MQVILFTPADQPYNDYAPRLARLLDCGHVAAVILSKGQVDDDTYQRNVKPAIQDIQNADIAALLDNLPGPVPKIGADGVHMTGGYNAVKDASEKLKPDYIVGAGDLRSKHESMLRGEADVDYILFGAPDRAATEADTDLADWWVETMQVDCALTLEADQLAHALAARCEFVAFGPMTWDTDEKVTALIKLFSTDLPG